MSLGMVSKLLFFVLWPFLLLLVYYLWDKEGFKRKYEQLKKDGFN